MYLKYHNIRFKNPIKSFRFLIYKFSAFISFKRILWDVVLAARVYKLRLGKASFLACFKMVFYNL